MLSNSLKTGFLIATAPLVVSATENQAVDHPNILWISVEDIGPLLGCYGVEGIHTPNIDRLGSEGIRYNHAYSTVGVCAPSRSSIITGMYPVSIGTHQYAFGSADRFDEVYDMSRSVLDGRFVYIRNFRPELPLIYRLMYREQIEMTRVLIDMDSRGELTGDASYILMKTKPREELYDLHADPFEVRNLADDPSHKEKLLELREALAAWQLEIGDMGFIPEYDLVEMMWPGLIQPETMPVVFFDSSDGLQLVSQTPGASIAYQAGDRVGGDHWELYHKPLSLPVGATVAAWAVRIGYQTSEITLFIP